jgi:Tfp pilus assembly protein FimT
MRNKAFGLLEALLVLVVAAVVALVAVRYYSEVKESEKIESLVQQWNDIYQALSQCMQTQKPNVLKSGTPMACVTYGGRGFTNLIKAGYLSGTIDATASTYAIEYNPWGATYSNANRLTKQKDSLSFQIESLGVPAESCNKIRTSALSKLPQNSTVTINGTVCIFHGVIKQ